ncbi:MAG: pteridine-dependent deoxygenase, partial [Nevskia sp.]|nr:pteridine-dependent deoxygenase [Nevskia sp.]
MNLAESARPPSPAKGRAAPLRIAMEDVAAGRSLPDEALCAFQAQAAGDADPRRVTVPLQPLLGAERSELWLGRAPVRSGRDGAVGWAENGEVLMLHLQVPEARLEPIEDTACALYRQIAAFAGARGYAHLWRVWHYLGGITQGEGDAERYRRFCAGRHRAFAAHPGFEAQVPAATAIGPADGGLILVALAGRQPGRQVENPAQTSAFHYPRSYGPRSPSFSRAVLLPGSGGARLLVSGTASIVGHASVFPGDP